MRSTHIASLLLTLILSSSFLVAQKCRVYEREMEEYFSSHESGNPINFGLLNRVKNRCPDPTPKMKMIYNFFRAVDAFRSKTMNDYEAYETATHYYDQAASHFSSLKWEEGDEFSELFYKRAEGMEASLATLAYDLGYEKVNRYYGQLRERDEWKKERFSDAYGADGKITRSMVAREKDPDSEFRKSTSLSRSAPSPSPEYDENGEPLGFVGLIGDINPVSYLKWLRESNTRGEGEAGRENARLSEDGITYTYVDPDLTVPNAETGINNTSIYARMAESTEFINVGEKTKVRTQPGLYASMVRTLLFGEPVYRMEADKAVYRDGKNFIQVFTRQGQTGWVDAESVVPEGKLAVITRNTTGFVNKTREVTAKGIIFVAGELIVLESYEDKWVKVVGKNSWKRAWINNLANLSVEEVDLRLALELGEVSQMNSISQRRRRLESLTRLPGFQSSDLANVVIGKLESLR